MKSLLKQNRVAEIFIQAQKQRILVVGDVMLDQFIWGNVSRISPEAPVPVLDFRRENYMPGGAANVARNLTAWDIHTSAYSVIGKDHPGEQLGEQLGQWGVKCSGLIRTRERTTGLKTRIVAQRQQIVRVDREQKDLLNKELTERLIAKVEKALSPKVAAVVLCDYGKGIVTQELLDRMVDLCRDRGIWLSMDPKPVRSLRLHGLSLMTPNRKEAFALVQRTETPGPDNPLEDKALLEVVALLMQRANPAMMLVTLGEHGMLLCRRNQKPFHIPTMAKEVYDVSGAGDTAIAAFTVAVAGGASPIESAIVANHAAGVVVGKVGTAISSVDELLSTFPSDD
ncbi:PfkB family carbohydrate kinase [Verrucomicrobia bacterium]|jgi:D-beta-D-heptose 7-phosphate kinase/D-beta-D-heptose 1-phosphate adenosyltransferase|nr:PfkB family carbohydrate kinase [Verrucomicrobiota bacterium]MDB4744453.1 PfkB family carbohydrate kinase [Verrucomicrobiota bacterium]MDC0264652.1 PfkB family carbohydrate kinase [Verrucomicrobiota bacterium]MDC0295757.1 PfkB family carbohydrate kinase [bacterium]